jgi:hypothetical protein
MSEEAKETLVQQLVGKSREAFLMGLEVFNKPTLKYRVEGFAFFICNAWELMLKAEMIQRFGEDSIYYTDNPERTISLSDAVKKVFTNDKDPLRKNLEKIIDLRNTGTHFITEEYGSIYAPLFQACVINFRNKMNEYHAVDVAEAIPENFLTLSVNIGDFTNESIRAKYSPELAEKLITFRNDLAILEKEENNPKFSISIEQKFYITKKKADADFAVAIDSSSTNKMKKIRELRDPSNTHNFSFGNVLKTLNKRITTEGIPFNHSKSNGQVQTNLTSNNLTSFINAFDLKNDKKCAYAHTIDGRITAHTYSPAMVDFIIDKIKKDPSEVIKKLRDIGKI